METARVGKKNLRCLKLKKTQYVRVVTGTDVAWIGYMWYKQYLPLLSVF